MLLIKWDVNDADYIYKPVNLEKEEEIFLKTILDRFIWLRILDDWDLDINLFKEKITKEEFNKISSIFKYWEYDEDDKDFIWDLIWELLPRNERNYIHTIKEVNVYTILINNNNKYD